MQRLLKILTVVGLVAAFAGTAAAQGVLPAYHEGFQHDVGGWITDDTPGPAGWCGDIEQLDRGSGPVLPSKGKGYAVVEHGVCNEYWSNNGFPDGSGPYAPFGGYSESWPVAGYTTELDIYLDPAWESGTSFIYAVSFRMLDDASFRYLMFPVAKDEAGLSVAGEPVSAAGWYTFRHRFMDQGGQLGAKFELVQNNHVLFTQEMMTTAFTGEVLSSFDVSNVGTGYSWFVAISDGLRLPIDEHSYVPAAAAGGGGRTK